MQLKVSFKNDYSEGAIPEILTLLASNNAKQEAGYGEDFLSNKAKDFIRHHIKIPDAPIYFVSGGTQANLLIISHLLRPYESVIAADTSHIQVHETGAIENAGHKINLVKNKDGKIDVAGIKQVIQGHTDHHMVKPALVYLSQTTEIGSIYSKSELSEIASYCKKHNLLLFIDGARLAVSLSGKGSDLSLSEIASLCDVFYIGATKNGGFLGEAIVFSNSILSNGFIYYLKQKGALMAKGRILGAQFYAMFEHNLFTTYAANANQQAQCIADEIKKLGYQFLSEPVSNQIFPILPISIINSLLKEFDFYIWEKINAEFAVVRIVTSWATKSVDVNRFLTLLKQSK